MKSTHSQSKVFGKFLLSAHLLQVNGMFGTRGLFVVVVVVVVEVVMSVGTLSMQQTMGTVP